MSNTCTLNEIQSLQIRKVIGSISSKVAEPNPESHILVRGASILGAYPRNLQFTLYCIEPALFPRAASVSTSTNSNLFPNCVFGSAAIAT